jgi:hypothetical protein
VETRLLRPWGRGSFVRGDEGSFVCADAVSYDVYHSTTNNIDGATKLPAPYTTTVAVITGLEAGTNYYVWVMAKNVNNQIIKTIGPAIGSPVAATEAPSTPSAPTVTAGDTRLDISWTPVSGAASYEVYKGENSNGDDRAKYGGDVTAPAVTITGLTNGALYYVWVKAKNSAGTSGFSTVASGTPAAPATSSPGNEDKPGGPDPAQLTKAIDFYTTDYTLALTFDDSQWKGKGTANESWVLSTAAEQHLTYFAVYKEATQIITVDGTDAAAVSMAASGTTVVEATDEGLTASDTLAVFTVKTGDLVFDGGTRTFALNVTESGALPLTVAITLNVTPNLTGGAVFKLAENVEDVEYLTRIGGDFDGLVSAFTWLESNAEAGTEYTIRVEKNETDLPHLIVSLNKQEGASLRLRGTEPKEGQEPWKLEPGDVTSSIVPVTVNVGGFTAQFTFIQVGNSFSSNSIPLITVILGKNITIQSGNTSSLSTGAAGILLYVGAGGTLVLEPGSRIQGHINNSAQGLIVVTAKNNNTDRDPHYHGRVRILGGSITNCTVVSLIQFGSLEKNLSTGCFYLAGDNALTLSGNNNNDLKVSSTKTTALDVKTGMSLPATAN